MTTVATTPTTGTTSSTSSTAANILSGQQSLTQDYSTFLTLLTTQLQNQDPTSPLDTNAFTQQLVTMTGVQQQLLTNQLLQQIATSTSGSEPSAVDMIGEKATATSSTATLSGGSASWSYNLPSAASGATITVANSSGQTIYSTTATNLSAGNNSFTWNGQNFSGAQLPDGGVYTLAVSAVDSSGAPISSTISVSGTVTSVSQNASGTTMVNIGATPVPLSSITSVSSP